MRALFNLPAPAKINWFLHVTGRRPDGYHTLQTVFQFIDWCDAIDLVRRDDGSIRRLGADDLPENDLCVRAARLLQQTTQCPLGVDIHLRKSIPQQAGLGGGSSDAATVLIGLNRLWQLGLSRETLMQLALQLGADVPIFIFGRNALAQGVGEELQAIDLPTPWFAVVHPARGLSTQAVFSALDLTSPMPEAKITGFAEWLALQTAKSSSTNDDGTNAGGTNAGGTNTGGTNGGEAIGSEVCGCEASGGGAKAQDGWQHACSRLDGIWGGMWGRNDLQQGAMALEPLIAQAESLLRELLVRHDVQPCFDVRMTGSGSAVFAWVCESGKRSGGSRRRSEIGGGSALTHGEALGPLPQNWQGRFCQGLARHPLQHWIDA